MAPGLTPAPREHATPAALARASAGARLALQHPPGLPELALWLVAPDVDLDETCATMAAEDAPPYWAFCWGAGLALARFVLAHAERVAGRRVVDLGAGSGVAALAAARAGASSVVAVDLDRVAREAVQQNALANGLRVSVSESLPHAWDVLLAADILYEPGARDHLAAHLRDVAAAGREVLIADPERREAPRLGVPPVARVSTRTYPDVDAPYTSAAIFALDEALASGPYLDLPALLKPPPTARRASEKDTQRAARGASPARATPAEAGGQDRNASTSQRRVRGIMRGTPKVMASSAKLSANEFSPTNALPKSENVDARTTDPASTTAR
jgi:predicted nicotinamide N-methyase